MEKYKPQVFRVSSKNRATELPTPLLIEVPAMRDLFQHRYYRINKMLLSFFGLWPYQTIRTRSVLVASTFVFSFSAMVPQVIAIVNHFDDWDLILDSVTSLTFDSFFLTKLFFTVFNSQKVSVIFFKA